MFLAKQTFCHYLVITRLQIINCLVKFYNTNSCGLNETMNLEKNLKAFGKFSKKTKQVYLSNY